MRRQWPTTPGKHQAGENFWMRSLPLSATKTSPLAATATPSGKSNSPSPLPELPKARMKCAVGVELLDAMVAGCRRRRCHPLRGTAHDWGKLNWPSPLPKPPKAERKLPSGSNIWMRWLNESVTTRLPSAIEGQPGGQAELALRVTVAAEAEQEVAVGLELLDAVVLRVGHVDVAVGVDDARRAGCRSSPAPPVPSQLSWKLPPRSKRCVRSLPSVT